MKHHCRWFSPKSASRLVATLAGIVSLTTNANVVGPSVQNFNPTPGGIDFLTVHSSETLAPGIINLGIFGNYAVNSLPVYDAGERVQSRTQWNDSLLMTDFNIGIGLVKNLEVGFSYPRLLRQKVDTSLPRGQFGATGNTEWRFLTKYRFFGNSKSGFATVLSSNVDRIINNPFAGVGAEPTYNLEFVRDWSIGKTAIGANIGYRWFQQGTQLPGVSIEPMDDQVIASVATSYLIESLDSKLIAEIFGSRPATDSYNSRASNRQASSLELLSGIKHDLTTNIALHGGAGTELISGAASPDWRIYAGVNVTNGPFWNKPKKKAKVRKPKNNKVPAESPDEETEPTELTVIPGESVVSLRQVQFDFNSADTMVEGSDETIAMLAEHLRKPPIFTSLVIEGHTDSVGSREFNAELSSARAAHIMKILVEKYKLEAAKIKAIGFGEDKPIADNGNFQGRQENRRVEFRINR